MMAWQCNDTDAILFREIHYKKVGILIFKRCLQYDFGWNKVKYARIMITHVFLIALTLARPLHLTLIVLL